MNLDKFAEILTNFDNFAEILHNFDHCDPIGSLGSLGSLTSLACCQFSQSHGHATRSPLLISSQDLLTLAAADSLQGHGWLLLNLAGCRTIGMGTIPTIRSDPDGSDRIGFFWTFIANFCNFRAKNENSVIICFRRSSFQLGTSGWFFQVF